MLQAKNKNGSVLTLASLKREAIEKIRGEGETFYCPVCENPVIMKAGNKMVPHFAHQSSSDCPSREGGEGIYHEQGKLLLYHWFKKYKMEVTLEAYLSEIQQRPDILLSVNSKKIAVEFQCARISTEEIRQRNEGYKAAGIFPIWIVGANNFTRYGANSFRIDQFTCQFIHQHTSESPQIVYYFHPHTSQIAIISHILIARNSKAIGKINVKALEQMKFQEMFQLNFFSQKEMLDQWIKEKRNFRLRPVKRLYGNELTWRKWLYDKGFHTQNLPSVIFLPVNSQHRMKTPLWNWQSKICMEIIDPVPIGGTFSIQNCKHIFKNQILKPSLFPLISSIENPIDQYLHLLEQLNYIQKISATTFKKIQHLQRYKTIEEAMNGDQLLLQQLFSHNLDKIRA
ncbi:competence protein CoiA [Oceanobacillus saliphilus]|uniref:competence protein CoiA n=1 Tax=Oceanobacillus saliphilus TaxID=2925834 RepID=UPI00201D6F90|nr:competence protein CoiA family protein [Oceanobacillus saliphilus]